jgi:hypothetical protein
LELYEIIRGKTKKRGTRLCSFCNIALYNITLVEFKSLHLIQIHLLKFIFLCFFSNFIEFTQLKRDGMQIGAKVLKFAHDYGVLINKKLLKNINLK